MRSASSVVVVARATVLVRIVRRELRALDDDARERFLGALHTLYTIPQGEGERRYGRSVGERETSPRDAHPARA